jgi:YD repeat-containing protein
MLYAGDRNFTYDLLGRMLSAESTSNVHTSFTYDALGRKTSEGNIFHGTTSFQYDLAGRRTRTTWKDGFFVTNDYLTTGETTHIRENGAASGVGVLATFGYDDLGRRTSLTRGNGTSTSYSYDAASRLSQLAENPAGTANDQTLGFSYNPASQIVTNTQQRQLRVHRSDERDRQLQHQRPQPARDERRREHHLRCARQPHQRRHPHLRLLGREPADAGQRSERACL